MVSRLRSRRQSRPLLVVGIVILLIGLVALIFSGYWLKWDWTGFNEHLGTNIQQYHPAKTLWDWLQLLFVPGVLTLGAIWFTARQNHDREIASEQHQTERDIAADNQREAELQVYIDKMSELLLDKDHPLRESVSEDEVRKIARVRTLTVLRRLDTGRKASVLLFLHESGLIDKGMRIIDLGGANLSGANLSGANLGGANLSGASLGEADLFVANLSGASLSGASLSDADLSGARVTPEQLDTAYSLKDTILPDGSKHS